MVAGTSPVTAAEKYRRSIAEAQILDITVAQRAAMPSGDKLRTRRRFAKQPPELRVVLEFDALDRFFLDAFDVELHDRRQRVRRWVGQDLAKAAACDFLRD